MKTKEEKREYSRKYYREHIEKAKERSRKYSREHPEKAKERSKKRQREHLNEVREYSRKYYREHIDESRKWHRKYRERYPYYFAEWSCQRSYGITLEEKNRMIENQEGKCLICGNEFKDSKDKHVDHCHKTNRVRGILCSHCNSGIGFFQDNVNILQKAIKYLEKK